MHPVWLWLPIALATPSQEVVATGFDRVWADLSELSLVPTSPEENAAPGVLVLRNGHTARATLAIEDTPIGELLPMSTARLQHVPAGAYTLTLRLSGGVVRTIVVHTEARDDEP